MDEKKYAVWPDGGFCELEQIEEYLCWRSDDYEVLTASEVLDDGTPWFLGY